MFDPQNQDAVPNTGSGLATSILGIPTFLSNQANRGFFYFEQFEMGLYFQDTWKVGPRTTLNLGVRWDRWSPYGEKFDRLVNVDLNNFQNQFQVITPGSTRMEDIPGLLPAILESWQVRGSRTARRRIRTPFWASSFG